MNKFFNNFTGGEWTPLLDGRSDLQKYDSSCRALENFRVMAHGGTRFRTGFEHKHSIPENAVTRLLPFQYSVDVRYVMEFSANLIRFIDASSDPTVLLANTVATPYSEGDLFELQIRQLNDVVYVAHPNYPVQKLKRLTATPTWDFSPVEWTWPAMLDENTTSTKLTVSGSTMTADADVFNIDHVGSYWEIRHLIDAASAVLPLTSSATMSPALKVEGEWQVTTTNYWNGELYVERSETSSGPWVTIRKFTSRTDRNVSASGVLDAPAYLRLRYVVNGQPFDSTVWVGNNPTSYAKANATLETQEAYVSGLVKVTGFTDSRSVSVNVIKDPQSTQATDIWAEGAWSNHRGHPRTVAVYEQRIFYGGTAANPIRLWGSKSGDFDNFKYGTLDDDAIAFDIASSQANAIEWMASMEVLQIGTEGSEVTASSGSREEPITPSNISVRTQSNYGSQSIDALLVNDTLLFMQRQGRRLREMSYSFERDRYVSPDLTQLAEHITESGVIQTAVARQPDPLVLSVLADGRLAAMTYDREQNVVAWAQWKTEGAIESVTSVYGNPNDDIWIVVNRGGIRSVEKLAIESLDKSTMVHLDASVGGDYVGSSNDTTTITGLDHLNGKTVGCVVLGNDIGNYVVAGGQITVPNNTPVGTSGRYLVGLRYTGVIHPMKLDVSLQSGATQGKRRRISEVVIRFKDSLGCKYGKSLTNLDPVIFRSSTDPMDSSPPLFSGDKVVRWHAGSDRSGDIYIVQDEPYPSLVLGLAVKFEVFNS